MAHTEEKIILLKASSTYDVLSIFLEDLLKGFESLGFSASVIDLSAPNASQTLSQEIQENQVKCFIAINCVGFGLSIREKLLYDTINIPLVAYFVDHPIHHLHGIPTTSQHSMMLFCDQTHLEFSKTFIPTPYPREMVPHGGATRVEGVKPFEDREIELAFFGSYRPLQEIEDQLLAHIKDYPGLSDFISSVLGQAALNNQQGVTEILFENLHVAGYTPQEFPVPFIQTLLRNLDFYVRNWRRQTILSSIQDFPIHIYGKGWENFESPSENHQFKGPIDFPNVLDVMNNTQVVLNILPDFVAGGHERIFYTMLQGAACLTDSNPWLEDRFKDYETLFFYPLAEHGVSEKVQQIFQDPGKLASVAHQGKLLAEAEHTWACRAKQIATFVEMHSPLQPSIG